MPIYKDNKKNTYYFKVCINGRQFLRRGFSTKKEATKAEAVFITQNQKNKASEDLTYLQLLNLYKDYLKNDYKITTFNRTRQQIDNYYSKLFPDIKISKLVYSDVLKAREIIDLSPINVELKNRHRSFLVRFFRWIRVYYDYDFYIIERMQRFKDYSIHKSKIKVDMVQHREFKKIFNSCDSSYFRLAFLTMYIYGLRQGELLGLLVNSFDFEDNVFEIYQGVSFKTGNGSFEPISPKSKTSQRFYRMPEEYSKLIKKHIQENHLKDDDYIFFRYETNKSKLDRRRPVHESTFRRDAYKYCRKYNNEFHFHMLRKSNVTHLHDKSIHLEEIKKFVGHSSSDITKNVYLQKSDEKEQAILDVLKIVLKDLL